MKKVFFATFIIFLLLTIEGQAQDYSVLTGTVTELSWRWLVVESNDGKLVPFRIGWRTQYRNHLPFAGDRVKVEYFVDRGVHVAYSVAILENEKKEVGPQKKIEESRPRSSPNLPQERSGLTGKWEGFWDNKKEYGFTLTISNVTSEVADVRYESKDLRFFEKAEFYPGEKPRIEWMVNSVVKPDGPFASPAAGTKEYYAILSESIPIYFSYEIQKDGTLKGTFDSKRMSELGTSRTAILKRVN